MEGARLPGVRQGLELVQISIEPGQLPKEVNRLKKGGTDICKDPGAEG